MLAGGGCSIFVKLRIGGKCPAFWTQMCVGDESMWILLDSLVANES